jgi:small subunit ribosomal protein S1
LIKVSRLYGFRQKLGDLVKARIVRIAEFGVFVEITPGIEGVVFLSELDETKIENVAEAFSIGEERNAKIIKLNPRERKISLSFRLAQLEIQKLEYQRYVSSQDNRLTLGDIMGDRFKKISSPKKEVKEKEEKND